MSWQPIPDFPGYEVSADGAVRSWLGRGPNKRSKQPHEVTPVWLASNRWGVRLNKDGKRHLRCVANLVLLAHVGDPPKAAVGTALNKADVVFADDDPTNISLSNLSWRIE